MITREEALSPHLEAEVRHHRIDIPLLALVDLLLERKKRAEKRRRIPKRPKNLMVFILESHIGWIQIELWFGLQEANDLWCGHS